MVEHTWCLPEMWLKVPILFLKMPCGLSLFVVPVSPLCGSNFLLSPAVKKKTILVI